jgi:hypothetical protein
MCVGSMAINVILYKDVHHVPTINRGIVSYIGGHMRYSHYMKIILFDFIRVVNGTDVICPFSNSICLRGRSVFESEYLLSDSYPIVIRILKVGYLRCQYTFKYYPTQPNNIRI